MKKYMLFLSMLLPVLSGCSDDENPEITAIQVTDAETSVVEGQQKLAFELFDEIKGDASLVQNTLFSPLSANMAISMLANGMGGQSRTDVFDFMHLSTSQIEELNSLNKKMISQMPWLDGNVEIKISNSLWVSTYHSFIDSFTSSMRSNYNAELFNVNFSNVEGENALMQWIRNATGNNINGIEIPESPSLLLVDCIKFNGKWTFTFDKGKTSLRKFVDGQGAPHMVPTMYGNNPYKYASVDGFSAVKLNYGKGKYSMILLLPDDESLALSDIDLDFDKWRRVELALNASKNYVDVYLPRFKAESATDLLDYFREMKSTEAFGKKPDLTCI